MEEVQTQTGNSPEFQARLDARRRARMEIVDAMPPEMRALVHEYGLYVVLTLHRAGVKKVRIIRHVVEAVLNECSPTRGAYSSQGTRVVR